MDGIALPLITQPLARRRLSPVRAGVSKPARPRPPLSPLALAVSRDFSRPRRGRRVNEQVEL